MLTRYKNYLLLHLIVLIFGFTAILGEIITIPSTHIVWFRMSIAAIVLYAWLKASKKSLGSTKAGILAFLGNGIIVAAHWVFFFEAIEVGNVSITLAALSSTTLFVAILEPLIFKRKIRIPELLFGVLIMAGLLFIFAAEADTNPNKEVNTSLGMLLGLISAAFAALFGTLNGKLINKHEATTISWYEMIGGVAAISIYFLFTNDFNLAFFDIESMDWFYLFILGGICTSFAFVVSVLVMKELSPFTVSLAINMEPVYGILLALVLLGDSEKMTPQFYGGGLLILATIFTNAWYKKKLREKSKKATLNQ